ncbi:MAG: hypothetical protein HY231_17650 [Acidobacteria bacterium]|nr:hypothetical protein [Acidobacteriota bacterium]
MKNLLVMFALTILFAGCSTNNSNSAARPEQVPQVLAANEAAAQARLRSIVTAEMSYQFEGDGQYATLEELVQKGAMSDPSQGKLTGYRFAVKVKPGGFEATAVPERFGITGKRSFFVDESRTLRAADKGGLPATASDPAAQ